MMEVIYERVFMFKVTFHFDSSEDVVSFAQEGSNLLEIAREANVAIDAPCSGNAACGKCKVQLIKGMLDSPKTIHITEDEYAQGWRLSCVSKVVSDVEVTVPDIASAYKSRMKVADLDSPEEIRIFEETREDVKKAGIQLSNDLDMIRVKMDVPSLEDTMPDNERLIRAVQNVKACERPKIPFRVLKHLSELLRSYEYDVTVVTRSYDDVVEVMGIYGADEPLVVPGVAIDIGTTSVAAIEVDMLTGKILAKASTGNGQIRYGADVINRIIESEKPGGRQKLQDAIIKETLNPLILQMSKACGLSSRRIMRVCIAGNTTMNHLLLGVYADPIRMEPYIPTFFGVRDVYARDLSLPVFPNALVIFAPNIGSYVGGDITAGTFASGIWHREEMSLFIDLGTNGELVFGNSEFMMSCACSAGPAFEGGDISCGMRATDGAIEAIEIDKDTMQPHWKVIGGSDQKPVGVCGSGIIDLISELFRCGIINPKGKFVREGERVRHDKYGMGSYVIAFREEAASVKDVEITEADIDNFMRAKGAIFSAIRTMLSSLDFPVDVIDDVYVAGGIGSGINMRNAINIGMFPDIPIEKFHYIGNSSLSGAYLMMISTQAEEKVSQIAQNMTYLELSNEPGYMDEFVASCFIPHTDASLFPSLTMK